MNTPLENEIAKRFGLLPNFFRLASSDRAITTNLWGFVQFGNLDNPLPSLFKVFARSVTASPGTSVSWLGWAILAAIPVTTMERR